MPPDREGGKTESDLYISIAVVRLTVTASRRRVQQGEGTNGERRTRRDEERGKDQRQGESQNRKSSLRAFRVDSWRSLRAARRRTIGGGIVGSEEGEEDEEILRLNTGVPVHGDAPPGSGPAPVRGGGGVLSYENLSLIGSNSSRAPMWNKAHQGFRPQSAFDELKMSSGVTRMDLSAG